MKTNNLIEDWKASNMSQVVGGTVINKEMMAEIQGGTGYIKTISGECSTSHKSCWEIAKDAVNVLFKTVL
jgi:hypothetical protein